jgi:hypothetical protein
MKTMTTTSLTMCMLIAICARAEAATLNLGAFNQFGLLATGSSNNSVQLTSDSPIHGNVGIGRIGATSNSITLQGAGDTIFGDLDFGASANNTASVVVTGMINTNVALVAQAIADAGSLASTYAGLANDPNTINLGSTPPSTISPTQNGTIHVYNLSANWANTTGLTINSGPNDPVVIDISGNANPGFVGAITLTGGITPDEVLWNVIGTGGLNTKTHSTTFQGDILIPNGKVNLDNFTMNGRIYGSVDAGNLQWVSGADLFAPAPTSVPESATASLIGAGLAGLTIAWRRVSSRGRNKSIRPLD